MSRKAKPEQEAPATQVSRDMEDAIGQGQKTVKEFQEVRRALTDIGSRLRSERPAVWRVGRLLGPRLDRRRPKILGSLRRRIRGENERE